jgi:hypothetical protein
MRHIDPNTWQDEFFGAQLTITERLIWLGMIASVADDQGRLLDNPALLRSLVFPYDDGIPLEVVATALEKLVSAGKVFRYQAQGKSLLQIVNWWKYQSSASWMSPSKYPPSEGWQDCYRYHGPGNTLVTSPNWKNRAAGFVLPSLLPKADVNDDADVNENGEKQKVSPATQDSTPAAPASFSQRRKKDSGTDSDISVRQELCQILQTAELPGGWDSAIETFSTLRQTHGHETGKAAQLILSHWTKTRRKNGKGTYSKLNPGWLDWLVAYFAGEKPWERAQAGEEQGFEARLAAAGYTISAESAP